MNRTTFYPGVSLTSTIRNLKRNSSPVLTISNPDTLTCRVYNSLNVLQAITPTVTGDGAGNYSCVFLSPTVEDDYYLIWASNINGYIGKQREDFQIRNNP